MGIANRQYIGSRLIGLIFSTASLAGAQTTVTNCSSYDGISARCVTRPSQPRGWAGALGAIADGIAAQTAREQQEKAQAQRQALDAQYAALFVALEERVARARENDAERTLATDREQRRLEAAYRLFQPKFAAVVTQFVDSLSLSNGALNAIQPELTRVAKDIFVAAPDASTVRIKDDIRPIFLTYSRRTDAATKKLVAWIASQRPSINRLNARDKGELIKLIDSDWAKFESQTTYSLNTSNYDYLLKAIDLNRSECLAVSVNCDEGGLSPAEVKALRSRISELQLRRSRLLKTVAPAVSKFARSSLELSPKDVPVIVSMIDSVVRGLPLASTPDIQTIVTNQGLEIIKQRSYSDLFKSVCRSLESSDCKALLIESDKGGEAVRVNGALVGHTPFTMPFSRSSSLRISVGEGDWKTDTTLLFSGDSAEVRLSVKTLRDPATIRVHSRAELESLMVRELPQVKVVQSFTAVAPRKPLWKRIVLASLVAIPASGFLAKSACEDGYEPSQCFKDGIGMGSVLVGSLSLIGYRQYSSAKKRFEREQQTHLRTIAERDASIARRAKMIDSAQALERQKLDRAKPVRSLEILQRYR